ncbi:ABC transporter substrate-binding protein [Ruania alba]|nr:ABC transporter substrate-binding protein [Ruania alba]
MKPPSREGLLRGRHRRSRFALASSVCAAITLAACVPGQGTTNDPTTAGGEEPPPQAEGPVELVVWTDPVRQVGFEMYQELHPEIDLQIEVLPDDVDSRLMLANEAGEGWPDIMTLKRFQLEAFGQPPLDFSADISDYVDEDILAEFSPGLLDLCQDGDALRCMNNDLSPLVLWYDRDLMEEFGYELPTTWEEFEEIGLRLADEHPGYIVGHAATTAILPGSRCPMAEVTGQMELHVDLEHERCTRVFDLVDNLVEAGTMIPGSANDPDYVAEYGAPRQILMSVQALHRGRFGFINEYNWPEGSVGIAPPLRWADEDEVHNYAGGGSGYAVSRHSEYQAAAAELAVWMATGDYQTHPETVTFPAYRPAQEVWIENNRDAFYTGDAELEEIIDAAESQLSPYWSEINLGSVRGSYGQVVGPELVHGRTIAELVPEWEQYIVNEAEAAGWTVDVG